MYSKDFRRRLFLTIFFAIGSSVEVLSIFGQNSGIISFFYIVLIFYIIFNYNNYSEGKYLWDLAFPLISLFSIVNLILYFSNFYYKEFRIVDSVVSLLVWIKCIVYLDRYRGEEKKYD